MERDREILKLTNVLRRIARAAAFAAWNRSQPDAAQFCIKQYNKVLARLTELEPAAANLFASLSENTSPEVAHMAARELAAYFADEAPAARGRRYGRGCGSGRVYVGWSPFTGRCW